MGFMSAMPQISLDQILKALHPKNFSGFGTMLFLFQLMTLIIYGITTTYSEDGDPMAAYGIFQNIHVMTFVGIGFLMTFMDKFGWSATGFTFLFSIMAAQWDILLFGFFHQLYNAGQQMTSWSRIEINITSLINADYCAMTVMVSFGAVMGKLTYTQMLVVTFFECIIFACNEMVVHHALGAVDAGGTMFIHAFGAYFGLMLSFVLGNTGKGPSMMNPSYHSGVSVMLGTFFLWVYWPSFNAGPAATDVVRQRAIINTILAIGSSAMSAFATSWLLRKQKFALVDVQRATLAGGVAIGALATMRELPVGAMIIGIVAGGISVFGFVHGDRLLSKLGVEDMCGIHSSHALPALLGGVASAIEAASSVVQPALRYAVASTSTTTTTTGTGTLSTTSSSSTSTTTTTTSTNPLSLIAAMWTSTTTTTTTTSTLRTTLPNQLLAVFPAMAPCDGYLKTLTDDHCGRSSIAQGGYQMAALFVSIGMGLTGGLIVGLLLRLSSRCLPFMAPLSSENYFDDDVTWKVTVDDASEAEDLIEEGVAEAQVIGKVEHDLPASLPPRAEPGCMDRCLPFGRQL